MKAARLAVVVVALLFVGYGSFGVAAPFFWGHNGYNGAVYMLRARMTLRHHTVDPLNWTGFDKPEPGALYYHHPVLGHHFLSALVPIFGQVEWLPRACNLAFGLVTILAIFAVGRRFFSPAVGALAALVWVTLPDIVSFSNMYDPMFLEMAAVLWTLYAWLALWERPTWRAAWLALGANLLGGLLMWEVFFVSPVLALVGLLLAVSQARRGQKLGRVHVAWVFAVAAGLGCVLAAAIHGYLAWKAGGVADMVASYNQRKGALSLRYIYDRHAEWVSILYGWPPLVVGGAWLVTFFVRVGRGRAEKRDAVPLAFLLTNLLYIKLFAEGSSVHLYRVSFFSCFFAFATADLCGRVARFFEQRGEAAPRALAIGLVPLVAYQMAELPHAYRNLLDSRATSSTHNGAAYNPDQQKLLFFREVEKRVRPDERVYIHYGQWGARKELWFYLDRSFTNVHTLANIPENPGKAVAIFDESKLTAPERDRFLRWIARHPVVFYDHFTLVDFRSTKPSLESYTFRALPMSRAYRWFVSHKFPPQEIVKQLYLPGACQAIEQGVAPPADTPAPPWPADEGKRLCRQHLSALTDPKAARAQAVELLGGDGKRVYGARSLGSAPDALDVYVRFVSAERVRVVAVAPHPIGSPTARLRVMKQGIAKADLPAPVEVPTKLPAPSTMRGGYAYVDELGGLRPGDRLRLELVDVATIYGAQPSAAVQKHLKPDPPIYETRASVALEEQMESPR